MPFIEEEKTTEHPVLSARKTFELSPEESARLVEWAESVIEEVTQLIPVVQP